MRAIVAVVEEGSFTAAAARLNATQSGVSQQVARLERSLGVPLLVRSPQGALPTPAGDQLYQHSLKILRGLGAAELAIRKFGHGVSGSIRLGLVPAMTRSLAGPALRGFMAEHPNVRILLSEHSSSDLIDEVAAGRIDLGVVPAFNPPPAIRPSPLGKTSEMLVHRGHRHKNHMRAIAVAELSPIRLILQSGGNIRRETILGQLKTADVEIAELLDLDSMFATLEFIQNSEFSTVLPAIMMAPEIENGSLCVRPIRSPSIELELIAIEPSGREQSPIATLLKPLLSAHIADLNHLVERLRRE